MTTSDDLQQARCRLRERQRQCAAAMGFPPRPAHESTLEPALAALAELTRFRTTDDPQRVRRGVFQYDRADEERRIAAAGDLIRRIDPGPFEDPGYLAILAYQAASSELALSTLFGPPAEPAAAQGERFLLGTLASPDVNAFASIQQDSGYTLVLVNAGIVDFIYQAAKAVVAAQHPVRSADPRSTTQARTDPAYIRGELARDDGPARHLHRTLAAHFHEGRTRGVTNELIPAAHHPSLSVLVGMAERFVVAHEYGHGHTFGRELAYWAPVPEWDAEISADSYAVLTTVVSARSLDALPPECALDGASFALACLRMRQQALAVLRTGAPAAEPSGGTHPPFALRTRLLVSAFHHWFDVRYDEAARRCELSLALERPPGYMPEPDATTREHIAKGGFMSASTLSILWEAVEEMLRRDHASGRPLCPVWLHEA